MAIMAATFQNKIAYHGNILPPAKGMPAIGAETTRNEDGYSPGNPIDTGIQKTAQNKATGKKQNQKKQRIHEKITPVFLEIFAF